MAAIANISDDLRFDIRALCETTEAQGKPQRGRPASPLPIVYEAILVKVLARLSARDVIPHIGPPTVHYNTLLRALVDTSKLDGLQRLLDRAQRAARDQGIAVDPPPNTAGMGLDDAFHAVAESIRAVLDAARAAEKTLVYREAPALAVVPRGTTFEEAARRDPSLLDRIKRAPRIPPSAS